MQSTIKEIIRDSYFHLLTVFILSVFALKMRWISSMELNFLWFAVVLGLFGFALVPTEKKVKIPYWLLPVAVVFALVMRIIPYIGNSVPLGYDPGFHKFLFEHPFGEAWLEGMYPMLFAALMGALNVITGSWFLLVPLFIILSALTGFVLYYVVSRLFSKEAGILAALIFAVSIAQFETFWFNYYKNVLGIILLLLSFLWFEKRKELNWKLIIVGGLIAGIHQVAFFIFAITYFIWVMIDVTQWKTREFRSAFAGGLIIIGVAMLVNADRVLVFLLPQVGWAAEGLTGGSGGGTFFNFTKYFYFTIPFIPFAITGIVHSYRRHLPLLIATAITASVVFFQLFFHNRFIIYLDIFIIIYAALGFIVLLETKRVYGQIITYGFLTIFAVLMVMHAFASEPLINNQEFSEIQALDQYLEENASIVSTDRRYSPWLKGYVDRPVIAPGLFDEDRMNQTQWNEFWYNESTRTGYMNLYKQPLYVHVGSKQGQLTFDNCFTLVHNGTTKLYEYTCGATA